ncbi:MULTISPECIES: HlyD family secretion protein [Grimontia]|uniref:Putative multidrug resistance protein EmrK n=1 Tax=Grimontia marina TaxID=646534 RepID=A0A128F0B1_9GAMM|nr:MULTISPECIES: HlyD family secretion protein [Grimontia]WRV96858.1 HlyD family secretion protein [Grimontia sp. NTOU-MAR1]CZF80248.1 putative multidrug resistance protein EmrK [Grimontia marina]
MTEKKAFPIKNLVILAGIAAILVIAAYFYIRHQEQYPSTDDAYIHGNILYIAPQISGQLTEVNVVDFDHVDQGQVIARINPAPYQARVEQAKAAYESAVAANKATSDAIVGASAQIQSASAQLNDVEEKYRRNMALVERGVLPKQSGDDLKAELAAAKNNLDAARARMSQLISEQGASGTEAPAVRQAAAALSEASLNLSYTTIIAPTSGTLGDVKVRPGSVVAPGQSLMPMIEDNSFWVEANYKEDALGYIQQEMTASIVLDMYSDVTFKGVVQAISPASGTSFSLLPPENATGNWVKVPQRFPVRLTITRDADEPALRVGASATVTIDTLVKTKANDSQQ